MFIKISRSKNFEYVRVVRAYREEGKTKHEVLLNLGRLESFIDNPDWQNVILKLAKLAGAKRTNLEDCSEAQLFNWGYVVYKKLWEKFKLDGILSKAKEGRKRLQLNLNEPVFLMVIQHLLLPASKLRTYEKQSVYAQLPTVELHHLYRSLDILSEEKNRLEEHLFRANRDLFNQKVDVVFYDVTTFHFESVRADSLREFGFSKNAKFNEVQVVLSLYIDCEGRPVGYDLFPGNTFEGKTLECALETLEKRFGIRNVIIVADRGINSKLNLKRIVEKGYGYIFASRIKSLSKAMQNALLDRSRYRPLMLSEREEKLSYQVIDYVNVCKDERGKVELSEKLIITYSEKRAQKDKADRERLLQKAQDLLKKPTGIKSLNKRGGKKYLKEMQQAPSQWSLDEAAVLKDQQFDGYYGIQTSEKTLPVEKILDAYHTLWKIEESFRIMKSTLEVRPIFHWTESRIKGHFVVCFLAFLLERTLEFKLKNAQVQASPQAIRDALNSMQFAQITLENQPFFIKTKTSELASKILRQLKIQPPKNVISVSELHL
jgi:transposase